MKEKTLDQVIAELTELRKTHSGDLPVHVDYDDNETCFPYVEANVICVDPPYVEIRARWVM